MARATQSLALLVLVAGVSATAGARNARFIVAYEDGVSARIEARSAELRVRLELPQHNAVAVEMTPEAARALADSPGVAYVEPDPPRYPMAQTVPYGIDLVQAREIAMGPDPVTVCVIDTGYDLGHTDLPSGAVDGFGDGWDQDECGHGTHVSGTVAALDNKKGVVGVVPGVSLFVVNVFLNQCESAPTSRIIDALSRCRDAGAKVINLSLGCSGSDCRSVTEETAFDEIAEQGILSVAAAGNDGNKKKSYPASYGSVISVAAIDLDKEHASFSQRNGSIELAAPGDGVFSTEIRGTGYNVRVKIGGTAYRAIPMQGSPNRTGRGPLVDCGIGDATCPGNGGHTCLIERGDITFADKVLACQRSGGKGAVIYNNVSGLINGTLADTKTRIPSVGITRADGLALLEELGRPALVKTRTGKHYGHRSGTSMASPHVAGVAALLWTHNASWTADEIRAAMTRTAEDLGKPGRDHKFGHGLVRAAEALDRLLAQ